MRVLSHVLNSNELNVTRAVTVGATGMSVKMEENDQFIKITIMVICLYNGRNGSELYHDA